LGPNDVLNLRAPAASVADLNKYSVSVKSWKVTEETSSIRIDAEAEHTVNDKNSFSVLIRTGWAATAPWASRTP